MQKRMLTVLVMILGLLLGGCQDTGEVENQAYVLVLAMDRGENDTLTLTARVPKIGNDGASSDKGGSGSSPYLTFSVSAPSWAQALDALQWATPRRINLSHIEMIVASEALCTLASFPTMINEVSEIPHLYTNARFVVCPGSAKAFLEAGETVIGTRLSSEIHTMLSQYARQGFIPDVCLADACYAINGIYGDPIAILADVKGTKSRDDAAFEVSESPLRQRFFGTALFAGGRFVRALSGRESRLFNLVFGKGRSVSYTWEGGTVALSSESAAEKRVCFVGEETILRLRVKLSTPAILTEADRTSLEASIRGDIARLIGNCQQLGCEPFGFAESAAAHFLTVPQWSGFDWRSRYDRASLDIGVTISAPASNR